MGNTIIENPKLIKTDLIFEYVNLKGYFFVAFRIKQYTHFTLLHIFYHSFYNLNHKGHR